MNAPILVTKLFVPPTRAEIVQRPGLIERLNAGLNCKLTLISAPAGFGKTTLVSHWVRHLQDTKGSDGQFMKVAWLSLDEDDNDLVRFLTYFIAALNQNDEIETSLGRGALSMLQSPQPPLPTTILISLINDLAAIPEKIIFVLDDYHLIEAEPIHHALVFLIENLPPQLHMVIATRQDPPLSLGRLRARAHMTELRAADLRFTSSEAADFLNQVMGLNLSAEDVSELETRTEGWIAGLQLVVISMQGRKDRKDFIRSFTGSNRLVLDFLIEEVLSQQTESIQDFLLRTAILDRMTGSLCDALTGQDNGQEILEILEHANLFIVPLDNERQWYRYHHLFADILRQRLRLSKFEELKTLHSKASDWYKYNGLIDQAIEHAMSYGDYKQAAVLIRGQIDVMWQRGEHGKLRKWLAVLPEETLIKEPQLGSIQAYYLHVVGKHYQGEHLLQKVEQVLTANGVSHLNTSPPDQVQISDPEEKKLLGRISVLRGLIDSSLGNVRGMIEHSTQALEDLPEDDLTWRSITTFSLGDAYSFLGDMSASFQARSDALRACEAAGNFYYIIMANLKLAVTFREQGKLKETAEICQNQIAIAKEHGLSDNNSIGYLMTLLGEIFVEWNELERGIDLVLEGVEIAERNKNIMILSFCYLNLLRVLFSGGNFSGMKDIITKVRSNYLETPMAPWLPGQLAIWQVRIGLTEGDLESASYLEKNEGLNIQAGGEVPEEIDYHSLFLYIVSARILMAQGQSDQAIELLHHLDKTAEKTNRITSVIETRMLRALAYQSCGEIELALEALERAIEIAAERGYFRIFVDEGPPMASLLYEALDRGIAPAYVQRLLAAFPVIESKGAKSKGSKVDQSGLIEPLSEREIEVLQLIAKGLTNQVIATRLVLSPHTIKTHTRNIFSKLSVNNRTQAVDRARTLRILPPN